MPEKVSFTPTRPIRMASILFKLRRFLIFSIAVLLIFIALSQGIVRLLLPVAHDQKHRLETELSQLLNADVVIGRIDSHWNYFVPYLDLLDIRLSNTEGDDTAHKLKRLSVGINMLDMLRAGSVAPSSLQLEGLVLTLAKKPEGGFYFPGLQLPEKSDQPKSIDWSALLSHKRVMLSRTKLVLKHDSNKENLEFDDVTLDFTSSGNRYRGAIKWLPPKQVGQATNISFDVKGNFDELQSLKGKIDINIPPIQLLPLQTYFPEELKLKQGHIGLNIDLQLSELGVASSRGELDFLAHFQKGKRLEWKSPIYVDSQPGKLDLLMNSSLTIGDQSLSILRGLGIELLFKEKLGVGFSFAELDLSHAGELVKIASNMPDPWPRRIDAMQLKGRVQNAFAGWDSTHGWNANARLDGLSLKAVDKIPGISSLDADILFKEKRFELAINEQKILFDSAGLFPKVFDITRLHTRVQVYREQDDWLIRAPSLFLNTPDIKTHSRLELRLSKGKKPYITLNSKAEDGKVASTALYVPTILKPPTLAWFDQAFIGGRVTSADAYIKGYVNELAREDSSAIFRIDAQVEGATFSYAKNWPILKDLDATFHMDGARMEVEAQKAEVFGVKPRIARAVIPNSRQTALELYIDAPHSPMDGLLRYVKESGINKVIGGAGSLFEGEGYADVNLSLKKNISKKFYKDLKPYFNGVARFQGSGLNMPSLDLQFGDLQGVVDFSQSHVNAKQLKGKINQRPFSAIARTEGTKLGPRASIDINTTLSLKDLLKKRSPLLTDRITGRSAWRGRLEIPLSKGQKVSSLSMNSRLLGTEIKFPAPISKSKNEEVDTAVFVALGKGLSNRLWFDYQKTLQGVLVFDRDGGGLYSGRLNYKTGKPGLPRGPGIVVDTAVDNIDIDPWLAFAESQGESAVHSNILNRIKLQAKNLSFKGVRDQQAQVVLLQGEKQWAIDVESQGVQGKLFLPKDKDKPLQAQLKKLNLNALAFPGGAKQAPADPRGMISTELTIDEFEWEDISLKNISADIKSIEAGLRVEKYQVDDPDLKLNGEGLWSSNTDGHQQTLMEFSVSTHDMKLGLEKIGVKNLLKRGQGSFQGSLSWRKPPYQLDFSSLSGSVVGEVNKGDLLAVKPGIAKLFGLLNVQSLPKRLALDFKDLSSKGLAFDNAHTSTSINQGIATFNTMSISTDLGEIDIEGRTDLVKQELDQIAKVNPDVSNLIPITAGVVGGVPGLVGALLVDQVVKAFGGDTDRVAQIRYKISGKWDDPVVESTRVDRVKDLTPEQLRQRAEELVIKAQGVDYGQDVVPGTLELDEDEEKLLFEDD